MATFALQTEAPIVHIVLGVAASTGLGSIELGFHRPAVAISALRFFMSAIQLELGAIVVKIPRFPATGVVAILTLRTEASLVHILLLMAAIACGGRIAESGCQMTLLALDLGMTAGELKARLGMIIGRILPEFFVMAALTLVAKLAIMLVILLVAGNALGFQFTLVNRSFCRQVAVVALQLQVLVPQPILGIAVMIKNARLPLFLGMASLALVAIAPFVALLLVILLVAGNTLLLQLEIKLKVFTRNLALVARLALGRLVLVA